jgi:uncharacterized protein
MTCPICRKPSTEAYAPFCSRRCANVDLGRWLTGGYAIPVDDPEEGERPTQGRSPEEDPST